MQQPERSTDAPLTISSRVTDERHTQATGMELLKAALLFAWKVSNHVRDILLMERGAENKAEKEVQDD